MKNIFFWHKRTKVHVDVFVKNKQIADYPIDHVSRYLPMWFKNLKPKSKESDFLNTITRSTFKVCDGFQYMMKDTYVLPMWTDFSIMVQSDGAYNYVFPAPEFDFGSSQHPPEQIGHAFDPMIHFKLHTPHLLSTKEDIKFHFGQATWSHQHFNGDLILPPATVKFTHQMVANLNMFLKIDRQYLLEAGMAMMYIIPMTEREVEFKTHVLSNSEYDDLRVSTYPNKFHGFYKDKLKRHA